MSDRPWLKFYPQDWKGDSKLRACSIAARGLWIELISLAHEATPYGHVLVNGTAPDTAVLARLTGTGETECESLIVELESNGVFSRTRQGVIYSRRMVKDAKRAAKARNNGKKGGNPSLSNQSDNSAWDNPQYNGQDKPQIPYSKGNKEKVEGAKAPPDEPYAFVGRIIKLRPDLFDTWRKAYPLIDIMAELQAADDYYADNPPKGGKWIFPVSSWLKRANDRAGQRKKEGTRGEDWW